jgi:hypothetical protein
MEYIRFFRNCNRVLSALRALPTSLHRSAGQGALVRELQVALSDRFGQPGVHQLVEIQPHRGSRLRRHVEALQERWNRLRKDLDRLLTERGAELADVPGGSTGLLVRDYRRKEAPQAVYRIDPGVMVLFAELRAHERQAAEELGQWAAKTADRTNADMLVARLNAARQRIRESALEEQRKRVEAWAGLKVDPV